MPLHKALSCKASEKIKEDLEASSVMHASTFASGNAKILADLWKVVEFSV